MRKGVSSSEPTAMISAFTARSVNENWKEKRRERIRWVAAVAQRLQPKRTMIVSHAPRLYPSHAKARLRDGAQRSWRNVEGLFRQQRQPLNIPRKMMHGICRRQNHGSSRSECQSHQTLAGDFEAELSRRSEIFTMPRLPDSDAATYRLPATSKAKPCGRPRPR